MAKRVPITVQTYFLLEKSWPGEWFKLRHFLESPEAHECDIDNLPTMNELALIRAICVDVLDPLRQLWEGPLMINSGFRCPELNRAVGGSATSDHLCQIGAAVDLRPSDHSQAGIRLLARFIVQNSRYGQMRPGSGENTEGVPPYVPPLKQGETSHPALPAEARGELEFDQLILYEGRVHIGYRPGNNRFELRKAVTAGGKTSWPEITESEI